MPPKDDRIYLTDREWKANCDAVTSMQESIEKIEREILVFKTKAAMVMAAIGTASSLGVTLAIEFFKHH